MADERGLMYTALMPSALPYPSAEASNVWQVDVGERTPPFIVSICCSGAIIRLAAATTALSQSPALIAEIAVCRQYREEEHAVFSVRL